MGEGSVGYLHGVIFLLVVDGVLPPKTSQARSFFQQLLHEIMIMIFGVRVVLRLCKHPRLSSTVQEEKIALKADSFARLHQAQRRSAWPWHHGRVFDCQFYCALWFQTLLTGCRLLTLTINTYIKCIQISTNIINKCHWSFMPSRVFWNRQQLVLRTLSQGRQDIIFHSLSR